MKIQEYIYNNQKINNITDKIINASNYNNIYIGNVSDNYSKMLAANYFLKSNKTVIYLTSNIYHAQRAYDIFKLFLTDFTDEEIQHCVTNAYGKNFDTENIADISHT